MAESVKQTGNRMGERFDFDHIHLISRKPDAAAAWYRDMFGAEIVAEYELRDAPQINVRLGGITLIIRGRRPGEVPIATRGMRDFEGYSSHDEWGTDHFGFTYHGYLASLCDELKAKGVEMAVEPWEFAPGSLLCYVAAPDGVSIELIQARD
jgi:catechol 2,3-dioxygenase-like lactoylglutathione lyase family enzyme